MVKAKVKKFSMRDKIKNAVKKFVSKDSGFSFLKGTDNIEILDNKKIKEIYIKEGLGQVTFDVLMYEVKQNNHPEKSEEDSTAIKGSLHWRVPIKVHKKVNDDDKDTICLKTFGGKCPKCEYAKKRRAAGADKDELKQYRPSERSVMFVRDINSKKIYIYEVSDFKFIKKIFKECLYDENYYSFPDYEEGYSIKVRYSMEKYMSYSFPDVEKIDIVKRDKQYSPKSIDKLVKLLPDIQDCLTVLSYDEVASLISGYSVDKSDDLSKKIDEEDENTDIVIDLDDDDDISMDDIPFGDDIEEVEEDDDIEEVEEKPVKKEKAPVKKKKEKPVKKEKAEANECPHGHKFGEEWDDYDECETCDVYDSCVGA